MEIVDRMPMAGTMRVLFVNHTGEVSGAEKVLLQMLRGLDRDRFEPRVLCAAAGPLRAAVEEAGVPCAVMPAVQARFTTSPRLLATYLRSVVAAIKEMRGRIREVAPDLLHANTVRAGIVTTIASVGTGIPVLWHVHDILPPHFLSTGIRLLAWGSKRTRAVGVSAATAKAFAGNLPFGERVGVLHNGIDLRRFPAKLADSAEGAASEGLRGELGLAADAFLFCAIGQIAPRKGLRELIEAFAGVCAANAQAQLLIVGEAIFNRDYEYRDALLQRRDELQLGDRVHFLGARKDVARIMRGVDIVVLNSLQEPFGLVLVEAMSSGTAVLAANVGGIPEIVTDGRTGWLVTPTDPRAVSASMLDLIEHREQLDSVQEAAITEVCPQFSEEQFLAGLHRLYARLPFRRRAAPAAEKAPLWNAAAPPAVTATEPTEAPGA